MNSKISKFRHGMTALAMTLGLFAAACGDSDPAGPDSSVTAGDYTLTQVRTKGKLQGGGSGLPVTFTDGSGTKLTFSSGVLELYDDGYYWLEVSATFKGNPVTMEDEGTYTRNGNNLSFTTESGTQRMFSAVMAGGKMTAQSQFGGIPFEIDLQRN